MGTTSDLPDNYHRVLTAAYGVQAENASADTRYVLAPLDAIADAAGTDKVEALDVVNNLKMEGYVEQGEGGNYWLSYKGIEAAKARVLAKAINEPGQLPAPERGTPTPAPNPDSEPAPFANKPTPRKRPNASTRTDRGKAKADVKKREATPRPAPKPKPNAKLTGTKVEPGGSDWLWSGLLKSAKIYTPNRYAVGLVGVAFAVALVLKLIGNPAWAVFGITFAVGFMLLLVEFKRAAENKKPSVETKVITWVVIGLFCLLLILSFTAYVIDWPPLLAKRFSFESNAATRSTAVVAVSQTATTRPNVPTIRFRVTFGPYLAVAGIVERPNPKLVELTGVVMVDTDGRETEFPHTIAEPISFVIESPHDEVTRVFKVFLRYKWHAVEGGSFTEHRVEMKPLTIKLNAPSGRYLSPPSEVLGAIFSISIPYSVMPLD